MKVNVTLPYEFYFDTQIVSLDMNLREQNPTYRRVLELLADTFVDRAYKSILYAHEIMVIIIVDNKRMSPDDQVRDGDRIILMMPLEGG